MHSGCQYESYMNRKQLHAGIAFYCINIFKLIGAVELLVPFLTFRQAHDQLKDQAGSSS